jgi:hypothetical protein
VLEPFSYYYYLEIIQLKYLFLSLAIFWLIHKDLDQATALGVHVNQISCLTSHIHVIYSNQPSQVSDTAAEAHAYILNPLLQVSSP